MTNREIKDLMRFFDASDISKVKIKNGEFSIELQKGFEAVTTVATQAPMVSPAPIALTAQESIEVSNTKEVRDSIDSPMVGTFYSAPAPGATQFARVGDMVKKGQVVGIIEAMKIMNEIEAEFDCKIIESLVEDGQAVEFGMPIFAVEKV